jgi:nicotinamide riboside transporter PnuC
MGWLASLLTLIGLLLNARKVRASWLVWIAGNLLWMMHGIYTHDDAILTLNVVLSLVNYYGFNKWRPDAPAPIQTEDHPLTDATFECAEILASLKARREVERRKDADREADKRIARARAYLDDHHPFR